VCHYREELLKEVRGFMFKNKTDKAQFLAQPFDGPRQQRLRALCVDAQGRQRNAALRATTIQRMNKTSLVARTQAAEVIVAHQHSTPEQQQKATRLRALVLNYGGWGRTS
jgi:hypothetical protein